MEDINLNEVVEEKVEQPKKRGRKKGSTTKKEEIIKEVNKEAEPKPQRLSNRLRKEKDVIDTSHLDRSRKVPVISVRNGCVGYRCKLEPTFIKWAEYGAEQLMSIGELLIMYAQSKEFLKRPWLIVDDMEFAETLRLLDMYEMIFETENLNEFFNDSLPNIKKKIDKLPKEIKKSVLERATIMVSNGEINSLNVVKLLKDTYKIDVDI